MAWLLQLLNAGMHTRQESELGCLVTYWQTPARKKTPKEPGGLCDRMAISTQLKLWVCGR